MVIVRNVMNYVTKEIGDLGLVGYRYTEEAKKERENDNKGLVVFFKGEYVKSIIITSHEYDLITRHEAGIVNDLGYILTFTPTSLDVYDIASHSTGLREYKSKGYGVDYVAFHSFRLEDFNKDVVESYTTRFKHWGLQLAVIEALKNSHESSYLVGREVHTPSTVFDFSNRYKAPIKPMSYRELLQHVSRFKASSTNSNDWVDVSYTTGNLTANECFDVGSDGYKPWDSIASSDAVKGVLHEYPGIELF